MNEIAASALPASSPLRHEQEIPDVMQALLAAQATIAGKGLPPALCHLVHLRASQINGCAHCVRMHANKARADGEIDSRLDHLVTWQHMPDYTESERAALAWTEALTHVGTEHANFATLRAQLRQHFSDTVICALTCEVAMINLWNRIAISGHR